MNLVAASFSPSRYSTSPKLRRSRLRRLINRADSGNADSCLSRRCEFGFNKLDASVRSCFLRSLSTSLFACRMSSIPFILSRGRDCISSISAEYADSFSYSSSHDFNSSRIASEGSFGAIDLCSIVSESLCCRSSSLHWILSKSKRESVPFFWRTLLRLLIWLYSLRVARVSLAALRCRDAASWLRLITSAEARLRAVSSCPRPGGPC